VALPVPGIVILAVRGQDDFGPRPDQAQALLAAYGQRVASDRQPRQALPQGLFPEARIQEGPQEHVAGGA
jgi:hypothetical protein